MKVIRNSLIVVGIICLGIYLFNTKNENFYLSEKNRGSCKELKGEVLTNVIFVYDENSSFTPQQIEEMKIVCQNGVNDIINEASLYNNDVNIQLNYYEAHISGKYDTESVVGPKHALKSLDLGSPLTYTSKQKKAYDVDEVATIFILNQAGRAKQRDSGGFFPFEYVQMFSGDSKDTLRHEFYHLFGALDYYYPDVAKKLAIECFGQSVMVNTAGPIDALTAYVIGYDDELDESATKFLNFSSVTIEDYNDANEKQTVTGYGEIIEENYKYYGDLLDGIPHGQGKYVSENGTYEGDFENGVFQGQGTYTYSSGVKCTGNFDEGKLHGAITITYTDGRVINAVYNHGKRIK